MEFPFTLVVTAVVISLVTFAVVYMLCRILVALYYNICYHFWHYKVMKVNGRRPRWLRLPLNFILQWFSFITWDKRRDTLYSGVSYWKSPKDKYIVNENRTRTDHD